MLKSWKTTLAGFGLALTSIGTALTGQFDADPATTADWPTAIALLVAAFGLLAARDNAVSSERAGAKP